MKLRAFVTGSVLLGTGIASAEVVRPMTTDPYVSGLPMYSIVGEVDANGRILARQVVPPQQVTSTGTSALVAQSKIIYLNKNGATLSPGDNDSRTQKSSIPTAQTTIPAWNVTAANWATTVSCMKDLFSKFDVQVTDVDPGNVPHMEALFGGSPQQVGMDANTAGVSPFTTDCSIIENSIVFTFTGAFNMTPREACEVMAQEVAHSYGLDHEMLASDPMTYLDYTGNRAFQNQAVSCGEYSARACGINGSTCRANQNSVALLTERLGSATGTDSVAPTLAWSSPVNNATVPPGFEVHASATDNTAVTGAKLKIDGTQTDMKTGAGPFVFVTPTTLAEGMHTVIIEITDGTNIKSETRTYIVKKGAPPPSDPGTGSGSGTNNASTDNGDITGGCSAGGGQGALLALGLLGFVARRRRR